MSYPHPLIVADECIACGVCADACPEGVLEVDETAKVIEGSTCTACGTCVDSCPAGAITKIAEGPQDEPQA